MRLPYLLTFALGSSLAIASPLACGASSAGSQSSPDGGGGSDGTGGSETSSGGQDSAPTPDSPADAPPDAVDNGAPSTSYPAPHPALPQLVNNASGHVLTSPKVYLVFYAGYPASSVTALDDFAKKMVTSSFWATTTSQYGVGPLAYGGTITLPSTQVAPTTIAQADIETWVASQVQLGTFGPPDPQAIYTIVYPQSTTITQPNPIISALPALLSCQAFGGYHDNTTAPDGGTAGTYAYAVIPTCPGSVDDDLTSVISHEWVEAATDPYLTTGGTFTLNGGPNAAFYSADKDHLVWDLLGGGEAGDLCEPESPAVYVTPGDIGHMVQRTWSNTQAQGSHDPCAPDIAGAFFDAAPVLTETVTFSSSITGTITTKGITIPVGQSKTIEVDMFSDGDPGGPWTVTADDLLNKYYGTYIPKSLSFAWDRTQGLNGEKLHLTVTVTSASVIAGAHAFMITSSNGTRQAVWPGLVVEQ